MTADTGRPRLREYRLQRGWTQQEMAGRGDHPAHHARPARPGGHQRLLRDQAQVALIHSVQAWFHDSETGTLAAATGRVPLIAGWPLVEPPCPCSGSPWPAGPSPIPQGGHPPWSPVPHDLDPLRRTLGAVPGALPVLCRIVRCRMLRAGPCRWVIGLSRFRWMRIMGRCVPGCITTARSSVGTGTGFMSSSSRDGSTW